MQIIEQGGYTRQKIIDMQYLTTGGIFGIPLGVSASVIVLFIIFASFVQSSGFADFVYEFSAAIMKKARGGPAKIAVIASTLVGSISGSSTANVVTTGSFTIPMMKKIGLKPEFAGAVEASASTVGLILPPVMSGSAFLMAAFTGIPYKKVCMLALLPALINVYAVYLMVHFETAIHNLQAVSIDVNLAETFKRYFHILIPPLILVFLIIKGYSPGFVCSWSIIAFIFFCFLRSHTRLSFKQILDTLEDGAKGALLVLVATAASGIIVGSVDLTGLGHRLASGLVELTGGNMPLTLIIAMLITLILGTGMPPAATYVVLVAILVPALVDLGISIYAAHFFVVFFAGQSLITPPMAITSYAAATIAGVVTAVLQTKAGIQPILSGILTMTGLYSVNLMVMDGKANIPLLNRTSIFTYAEAVYDGKAYKIFALLIIIALVFAILNWFFRTQLGLSIRAAGDNEDMCRASSIDTDFIKIVGFALSNGIVALSGALVAQMQQSADVNMGTGMVVISFASIIIGGVIIKNKTITLGLFSVIIGSVIYRFIIALILTTSFPPSYLKLISALVVITALSVPKIKRRRGISKLRKGRV